MSMGKKGSLTRRLAAIVGALAVGAMGLAGVTLSANADDAITGVGNINTATPRSLTIHKYDGNPGTAGDGSAITDEDAVKALGNPLNGVEFTITPVTAKDGVSIDLTKYEGWNLISGATADGVTEAQGYTFGTATTVKTGVDGSATAPNLPIGLYKVTETGYGTNTINTPAAPFLVTLPLSHGNGQWLYDVHVYPKNVVDKNVPTKEVADPTDGVVIGSTVPWTIKAPVQPDKPGDITKFMVSDKLDSRLSYKGLSVEGFAEGADYTVDPASAANGNTVTVTFTADGLKKLKAGDVVTLTLNTTVVSLGDGVIPNQATVFTNDNGGKTTSKPGEPGTNPTTNWGPLAVLKHAEGDEQKVLAGAEFTVYSDEAATKPVGSFTTGADGKGSIVLFVGNDSDTSQVYYLKETKAPAGYVLDSTVHTVTVNAGVAASAVVLKLSNKQQDHPNLPLTGAAGTIVMTLGGLALVVAGGAAYTIARKRSAR